MLGLPGLEAIAPHNALVTSSAMLEALKRERQRVGLA